MQLHPSVCRMREKMLDHGDRVVFVDARNPVVMGRSHGKVTEARSGFRSTKSTNTSASFQAAVRSSPTVLDPTRHRVPVWHNSLRIVVVGMFGTCKAASTLGVALDTPWN